MLETEYEDCQVINASIDADGSSGFRKLQFVMIWDRFDDITFPDRSKQIYHFLAEKGFVKQYGLTCCQPVALTSNEWNSRNDGDGMKEQEENDWENGDDELEGDSDEEFEGDYDF